MTPTVFGVRELAPADVAAMNALLDVFAEVFREERAVYRDTRPDNAYLEDLLGRDGFVALVATKGEVIVAGLTAYLLPKPEQPRSELYVYDLAVAPEHRRQGIATALLRAVQRIAAERGAWTVFVQADHGDAPALALYESLGKRQDVVHFDLPVEPRA